MHPTKADLKITIRKRMAAGGARGVWTPADFVDVSSRDAVDKALQRMVRTGELRRIDRGLYDRPSVNSLTQKMTVPDPRAVIEAIARRDQIRVLVDGMTAANDIGLSDAVPAKIVVHTDARLQPIRLGNLTITFRPTAASKLYWAGRPAMRIVQALHWLRDMFPREGEDARIKRRLAAILNDPGQGAAIRADLKEGLSTLPTWMQSLLKPLLTNGLGVDNGHHDDHTGDNQPSATTSTDEPATGGYDHADRQRYRRSAPKHKAGGAR